MLFGSAKKRRTAWIPVRPKNYRRIALYAIGVAGSPVVLVNGRPVTDFSEAGPLTQRKIRGYRDFEIRDGDSPILGFHDHPDEMWVTETHAAVAHHCASQGWLKIQGAAS
ncbi:MAG TPA: hypothetical protein VFT57_03995 [Gemmatimonadaceae bacterium]|jgi:hypothetical protein|nr:hypothetical protein [Gemmatimonadaceae bacterium]